MTSSGETAGKAQEEIGLAPPGASIRVERGFYEGLELPLDRDWMVVGRGRSADVVIAEPTISRSHAAIGYDAEGFFVQDLDSTNGTKLNDRREAGRARLAHGDVLRMGKLVLRVTLPR